MSLLFLDNSIRNLNIFKLTSLCIFKYTISNIISDCSFITINNFEDFIEIDNIVANIDFNNINNAALVIDTKIINNYLAQKLTMIKSNINIKIYNMSILENQQTILTDIDSILFTTGNSHSPLLSDFYSNNIFFKQSIKNLYFYEKLITNTNTNTNTNTHCKNVLLIDKTVSNYAVFLNSANSNTYPIVFNYNTDPLELLNLLTENFTTIERIAIVSTNNSSESNPHKNYNMFINNSTYFTDDDLVPNCTNYSDNLKFIINLIDKFNIKTIDFLACETLKINNWRQYYDILSKYNVNIGASIDNTGNILYGGNWIMETTNIDIKNIYFTENIGLYHSTLVIEDCIWTFGPTMPLKISMQCYVLFKSGLFANKLLLMGGTTDTEFSKVCLLFDPATNTWTQKADMIYPRVYHSAVILKDNRVLVIGNIYDKTCEIYNPITDIWTRTTDTNFGYNCEVYPQMMSSNIVLCDNLQPGLNKKVLAYSNIYQQYEIYDPATEIWTIGTYNISGKCLLKLLPNYKIMFFNFVTPNYTGMINISNLHVFNANNNHIIYDSQTDTFTNTGEIIIPIPISGNVNVFHRFFLFCRSNDKLYVFFELYNYKYISWETYQIEGTYLGYIVYDPSTNSWTFGKFVDISYNIASFALLNNDTLFIQSRYTTANNIYDIDNDIVFTYSHFDSMINIYDTTIVLNNDKIYMFGGCRLFNYLMTDTVYIITPPSYTPPAPPVLPISRNYFFNEPLYFTKSIGVFSKHSIPDIGEYDYIIKLNMSLNDFFITRSYQQNQNDINNIDITFNVNQDNFNLAYNNTLMDSNRDALIKGSEYVTSCDTRILEIIALKIFGHAKARTAIKNDTSIISGIKHNLFNFFNNIVQNYKTNIFNQYVQYDLVDLNNNDINEPINFNFTNDVIDFPGYIHGSLLDTNQLSSNLLNGPTSGNSSSLINGVYNIPILIKFGQT